MQLFAASPYLPAVNTTNAFAQHPKRVIREAEDSLSARAEGTDNHITITSIEQQDFGNRRVRHVKPPYEGHIRRTISWVIEVQDGNLCGHGVYGIQNHFDIHFARRDFELTPAAQGVHQQLRLHLIGIGNQNVKCFRLRWTRSPSSPRLHNSPVN
jgi:hypothetical protein